MKTKILNICLILTSLMGYLEWGGDNTSFLIESEMEFFSKFNSDSSSILHPLILLPVLGQLFLLYTLFQKLPSKKLTIAGLTGLGVLMTVILLVGIFSLNYKIFLSTIPFIIVSLISIKNLKNI